ncbi:ABC transporter substrate-binding protein [Fusicatenibacter sp.]
MTGKNERKLKKWAALFLTAAMALTACGSTASTGSSAASSVQSTSDVSESTAASDLSENTAESTEKSSSAETDSESEVTEANSASGNNTASADGFATTDDVSDAPEITGVTIESKLVLNYAECFNVYYCADGYKILDVKDGAQYLLVPEGKEAPDDLDSDVIVIHQPLERIYMAATSPMALFDAIDSLDTIRLSGETANNWYVQDAVDAMNAGTMIFAGKYSEPDYELLVSENCDLAVESTMILHAPKVQEMIEMLDIPVFIDRSSYETQPLGRTEWIKLYGAMLNKEKEASEFFANQAGVVENLKDFQNTEKTVAFFYINTSGAAVVRNPEDYISNMIELGGARNAFRDLQDDSGKTSVPITMEQFYDTAENADYLIYNASIDSTVKTLDDLLAKDSMFADYKAVKEGNVWTTEKSMYQATDRIAQFTNDINLLVTGGDPDQMVFLRKLS